MSGASYKAHLCFWRKFLGIFSYEINTILWINAIVFTFEYQVSWYVKKQKWGKSLKKSFATKTF
jgi:hypothetical protein